MTELMQLDRPFAVVTPTLDGDVLAVLAQADAHFTSGQIRRILLGYSEQGIRNVLTRLAEQGIVIGERVGNAVAYRLNREHLAAPALLQLVDIRTTLLAQLGALCASWEDPPVFAALFGSAVQGGMSVGSDIDLFIVHRDGASELVWDSQVLAVVLSVARWTGNRAEVMLLATSEVAERASEPALRNLRTYALTFAGSRSWFDGQFASKRSATR